MILKTELTFEEIKKRMISISNEVKMKYEFGENYFKMLDSNIIIEAIFENNKLKISHELVKNGDTIYPVFRVFFLMSIILTLIAIIVRDEFFLIEKIIYSIIGLIVLLFHSIIVKLLSIFIIPSYQTENEVKLNKLLLKLKKELV